MGMNESYQELIKGDGAIGNLPISVRFGDTAQDSDGTDQGSVEPSETKRTWLACH